MLRGLKPYTFIYGIGIGTCTKCHKTIIRQNKEGKLEWMDGKDPWINDKLRPAT